MQNTTTALLTALGMFHAGFRQQTRPSAIDVYETVGNNLEHALKDKKSAD